jgi:hypothetical protein
MAAAAKILGCYDTITASDPKVFAAGLVELLAMYPVAVVERAADPARGLPALVKFPNLASFHEQLERFLNEYDRDVRRERHRMDRENQKRLSAPPRLDDEKRARIIEGFRQLTARLGG